MGIGLDDIELNSKKNGKVARRTKVPDSWRVLLEQFRGKSLAIVFHECQVYKVELIRKGSKLYLEFRHISEDKKEHFLNKQLKDYDTYYNILTSSTIAIANFGGAFYGPAGQMISQAISHAIQGVEKQYDNGQSAAHAGHEHFKHHASSAIDEHRTQHNQQQQQFSDLTNQKDRNTSLIQELFAKAAIQG